MKSSTYTTTRTHKYRLSRLNELEEEAKTLRRISIERLSEQERAPPLTLVVWRDSDVDRSTSIKMSLSRYREEWKDEVAQSRKKSEILVNALKANCDDIRSCRDAKASMTSMITTLKNTIKHVSQILGESKEKQKRMDADVKSASVVVTCMEAAKETEQIGMPHHRRGSSSNSSISSFGSNNSSISNTSHRRTRSPHFVLTGTGMMMAVPRRKTTPPRRRSSKTPPPLRSQSSKGDSSSHEAFDVCEDVQDEDESSHQQQKLLRLPIREPPQEGALLLAAREAQNKALRVAESTKKEVSGIEEVLGDLELMLESATAFLTNNEQSMIKVAESTRKIPEDVQQCAKVILQYAEEGCKWQQVASMINEAWCAAEDEKRLRIKKLATIRRLVVSSTSELCRNVEAMENRISKYKTSIENSSIRVSRCQERLKFTEQRMKNTLRTMNSLESRLKASLRRQKSHEERGPLHLCCSSRFPLCRAEREWQEFELKRMDHEKCIKGANEDEASYKMEMQSSARRIESRHEVQNWLEAIPSISIRRSNANDDVLGKEKEEKDDDENLKMITRFHVDIASFRKALVDEKSLSIELFKTLDKEASYVVRE